MDFFSKVTQWICMRVVLGIVGPGMCIILYGVK
jgi:hypothetical protein